MNEMFPVYKGMLADNNNLIPYYLPVYYLEYNNTLLILLTIDRSATMAGIQE